MQQRLPSKGRKDLRGSPLGLIDYEMLNGIRFYSYYHSLVKEYPWAEYPWAEYLTSLPKRH